VDVPIRKFCSCDNACKGRAKTPARERTKPSFDHARAIRQPHIVVRFAENRRKAGEKQVTLQFLWGSRNRDRFARAARLLTEIARRDTRHAGGRVKTSIHQNSFSR
jgi:hypothetical protein